MKIGRRLLIGIMLFILAAGWVIAEMTIPASVTVESGTKNRLIGETFNVNVTIDPLGQPISGAQLDIYYNESMVRINSVTEGNLFSQNGAKTFFSGGVGLINETYNVSFDNNVTFYNGTHNQTLGVVRNIFNVIIGRHNVSTPGTFAVLNVTAIGSGLNGSSKYILTAIGLGHVLIADPNASSVWLNATNGTAKILVPLALTTATINPAAKTMAVNSYSTFSVTGKDQFGSGMYNIIWEWTTSNASVAIVNQTTRKVTAISKGIAFINATNGTIVGSSKVTVA